MGHSVQLDEVYYDKGSEKSRAKLLEEYCKAIDALTINEENRLKLKVRELTSKNETNEYIIKHRLQEKEDKLTIMEERFNKIQSQMQTLLTAVTNIKDQNKIDEFAKTLYDSGIVKAATRD